LICFNSLSPHPHTAHAHIPYLASGNSLTGSIPPHIFAESSFNTFGAGKNCIEGSIPDEICKATSIRTVLLHALSLSCSSYSKMTGTIPSCLFLLPSITSLYVTGNNLGGTIPSATILSSPGLVNLSISYNVITGTIPESVAESNFGILDISHNHITGYFPDGVRNDRSVLVRSTTYNAQFSIDINRFSGNIPYETTTQYYNSSSVLSGNLFSCNERVPPEDPYYKVFSCGSENLDSALISISLPLSLTMVFFILYTAAKWKNKLYLYLEGYKICKPLLKYLEDLTLWHSALHLIPETAVETQSLLRCTRLIRNLTIIIIAFMLIFSLVFYPALKSNLDYATFFSQYNWLVSILFLKGKTPAILIIFFWLLCILLPIFFILGHAKLDKRFNVSSRDVIADTAHATESVIISSVRVIESIRRKLLLACIIALNCTAVVSVNVGYVYSKAFMIQSTAGVVQVSIAVFKIVWNIIVVDILLGW